MHELSIALSILDIATEESESRGGVNIVAIHLQLGPLSGVLKEALLSAFEMAREQSLFPASRLIIEDVPLVVFCPICKLEQTIAAFPDLYCPTCKTPCGNIIRGRELEIVAMELEEPELEQR
jgi:hydrogenase nickel incorporation protein HypA/HybF